jgi:hypothetical protein
MVSAILFMFDIMKYFPGKAILLIFMIGFKPIYSHASAVLDSLKKELSIATEDSARAKILFQLLRSGEGNEDTPYPEALLYSEELLLLGQKLDNAKYTTRAGSQLGIIYYRMSAYRESLYYSFYTLKIIEGSNDTLELGRIYNVIGVCYMGLKRLDQALYYLTRSYKILEKKSLNEVTIAINNIGLILIKQHKYKESIAHFKKEIERTGIVKNTPIKAGLLINLAEAYRCDKQYKNGLLACEESIKLLNLDKMTTFDLLCLIEGYNEIGQILIDSGDLVGAEKYLKMSVDLGIKHQFKETEKRNYELLLMISEMKGDYKKALYYQKKFHEIKDSLSNIETADQISGIEAKYDSEKKDGEIQLLKKDKEITDNLSEKAIQRRNTAIILFVLILTVGIILFRNNTLRQRVKSNMLQEDKTRIELQKQQAEKEIIKLLHENSEARYEILKSKINPHFLFNCFATLSSLIIKDQTSARKFVKHFSGLFRSIIETSDQKVIRLDEEMKLVSNYIYLQEIRLQEKLQVKINVSETMCGKYLPPFSVQMSIENAIKHNALPNGESLYIDIYTEEESLVIANNFRPEKRHSYSASVGQQNITDRYTMLSTALPSFTGLNNIYSVKLPLLQNALVFDTDITIEKSTYLETP